MKIFFLHIPKAAGTTFRQILNNEYNDRKVCNLRVRSLNDKTTVPDNLYRKYKVFSGHFDFGFHGSFGEPFRYITFLREPVSRILSHYKYVSRTPVHDDNKIIHNENLSFKEYALSDLSLELDNGQTRQIAGDRSKINELSISCLETVKKNLADHFEVGITERFDESIILFKEKLNWRNNNYYYKKLVSKTDLHVDEETEYLIRQRNRFDVEVYNWALSLFIKRIKLIPDFDEKLRTYRKGNKMYSDYFGRYYFPLRRYVKSIIKKSN